MEQREIWRTAGMLIALHGPEQALFEAAQRADAFLESDDARSMGVWVQVVHAVEALVNARVMEPLN